MTKPITAHFPVHAEVFPEDIVQAIHDHDEILEFIMAMDANVEDYDFTKNLIARLQQSVDKDFEPFNKPLFQGCFVPTKLGYIVWVVVVDKPNKEFIGMDGAGHSRIYSFDELLNHNVMGAYEEDFADKHTLNVEEALEFINGSV